MEKSLDIAIDNRRLSDPPEEAGDRSGQETAGRPLIDGFPMTPKEIRPYSALAFAYIGDSVFDTIVKTFLLIQGYNRPKYYHAKSVSYVSASAQTKMMKVIRPLLTEEEREIFRRGRNSKVISPAKNQSLHDYRIATGFEALIGYLYLLGRQERMMELVSAGMDYLRTDQVKTDEL